MIFGIAVYGVAVAVVEAHLIDATWPNISYNLELELCNQNKYSGIAEKYLGESELEYMMYIII